jgi:hypothetical protein
LGGPAPAAAPAAPAGVGGFKFGTSISSSASSLGGSSAATSVVVIPSGNDRHSYSEQSAPHSSGKSCSSLFKADARAVSMSVNLHNKVRSDRTFGSVLGAIVKHHVAQAHPLWQCLVTEFDHSSAVCASEYSSGGTRFHGGVGAVKSSSAVLKVQQSAASSLSFVRIHWVAGQSIQIGVCSSDCSLESSDKASHTAVLRVGSTMVAPAVSSNRSSSSSVRVFALANASGKHMSSALSLPGNPPSPGDFFDLAVGHDSNLMVRVGRFHGANAPPSWASDERFQPANRSVSLRTDVMAWHLYLFCSTPDGELRVDRDLQFS